MWRVQDGTPAAGKWSGAPVWSKLPRTSSSLRRGPSFFIQLNHEHPLVHDASETVDDTGPVEVQAYGPVVFEGVETGPRIEGVPTGVQAVPAEGLRTGDAPESPTPDSARPPYPGLSIYDGTGFARSGSLQVRVMFVLPERGRGPARIEGV